MVRTVYHHCLRPHPCCVSQAARVRVQRDELLQQAQQLELYTRCAACGWIPRMYISPNAFYVSNAFSMSKLYNSSTTTHFHYYTHPLPHTHPHRTHTLEHTITVELHGLDANTAAQRVQEEIATARARGGALWVVDAWVCGERKMRGGASFFHLKHLVCVFFVGVVG